MKYLLIASTFLITTANAAHAADAVITEPAPEMAPAGFSWTGGYVGVQGGYLRGTTSVYDPDSPEDYSNPDPDRFIGGAYAGYTYQFQNGFVAGIEGDAALSNATGSDALWNNNLPWNEKWTAEVNWTAAIRARAGFAIDRTLLYATGGVAFAGTETVRSRNGAVLDTIPETLTGWTVGAGVEQAITENLIARLDYRYSDFGSNVYRDLPGTSFPVDVKYATHDARLGLAYKF